MSVKYPLENYENGQRIKLSSATSPSNAQPLERSLIRTLIRFVDGKNFDNFTVQDQRQFCILQVY